MQTIAIYAALMGGVLGFMLRRPGAAIGAVLCMFGLEQWAQAQGGFFVTHQIFANVAVGLLVVFGCALLFVQQRLQLSAYPAAGWAVLGLIAFAGVSYVWTVDRGAFVSQWRYALPYVVTIAFLMPLLVGDWINARSGLLATLAMGAIVLLLLTFTTEWSSRGRSVEVWAGQQGNPLAIASLGGYVAIIAALMNFQGTARFWQLIRWPIVVLGVYIVIQSGSRGQALALLAAVVLLLPMSRKFTNIKGFALTLLAVAFMGGIAVWAQGMVAGTERWATTTMEETYLATRLETSFTVLDQWAQAGPVRWMIGLGNSASFEFLGGYPHLVGLEVLAEEGLIGFGLFCLMLFFTTRAIITSYRWVKDQPVDRGILAAFAGLFTFTLILSCKQGSMIGSPFLFGFAIVLGRMELSLRQTLAMHQPLPQLNTPAPSVIGTTS